MLCNSHDRADDFIQWFERMGTACRRTKALLENPPHVTGLRQMMRSARKTADVAARAAARRKAKKDEAAAKVARRKAHEKKMAERWQCEICDYMNPKLARVCGMCETAKELMMCYDD